MGWEVCALSIGLYLLREGWPKRLCCALLAGWLFLITGTLLATAPGTVDYYTLLPLGLFVLLSLALATVVFCLPGEHTAHWLCLVAALAACITAAWQGNHIGLAVGGCCGFFLLLCWLGTPPLPRLAPRHPWIPIAVMAGVFTLVLSVISVMKYRMYLAPNYDFGIFAQMYEYMLDTGLPLSTCERDGLLSHFAVHISPIFYLLLPLYALAPCPETLLIAGCALVASGVIPLVLICRARGMAERHTTVFAGLYLLYPCFAGGCLWHLHENNFLPALLLWLLLAIEKHRPWWAALAALAVCCVKEDAAVYVAVIAMYCLFTADTRRIGRWLLLLSVLWFLVATGLLAVFGDGVMTGRYENYANAGEGLFGTIRATIQDPLYVLGQSFAKDKWGFILQTLLPLGLLPLLTRKPTRFILWIPYVLVNLMSNYGYQHHVGFQYGFGSGALLLYLTVLNHADNLSSEKAPPAPVWRRLPLLGVCFGLIVGAAAFGKMLETPKGYAASVETRACIDEVLEQIPEEASVSASTFFIPHLADQKELYELGMTKQTTTYYAIDLRFDEGQKALKAMSPEEYDTLVQHDNIVALLRRKEETA